MPARRLLPVAALTGVTAIWGWTFVVVRDAVHAYPVLPFLAMRFVLASIVLLPILMRRRRGFRQGVLPGVLLAMSYLLQTLGLQHTSASKAGLLTGLFVVLTPVLGFLVMGVRPRAATAVAVAAALVGTVLLTGPGAVSASKGELLGDGLEILTALCLSVHILLLGRVDKEADAAAVALAQMVTAAILFSGGTAVQGFPVPSGSVLSGVVITGVLASAVAFWIQTLVQQRISAARTAIILVAEPAFATLFGYLLAGDRFDYAAAAGAGLILAALIFHEFMPVSAVPQTL